MPIGIAHGRVYRTITMTTTSRNAAAIHLEITICHVFGLFRLEAHGTETRISVHAHYVKLLAQYTTTPPTLASLLP